MTTMHAIVMPKWGLAMQEGTLIKWHVGEGSEIKPGLEICDIETSKITNAMEATASGRLRRRVAAEGVALPVGALIAVVDDGKSSDAEVDAFVAKFAELSAARAASAVEPRAESVKVGGCDINFLRLGQGGVPIVLVHGFGGDLNNWMFNQPALAEEGATVALDLPGHGGSAKAVADGSVAGLAQILSGFLDAAGIDAARLVGHSLGGAIALKLALDRPERCKAVTLIASAGLGAEINGEYLDGFVLATGRKDIKPYLDMLFADPSLVTRDLVNDILKFKRMDGVEAALGGIAATAFPGGRQASVLRDRLGDLRMPAQLIFGAKDRIIPPAHATGLPAKVTVHLLPSAGHMAHMEAAGEVNRLIASLPA